MPICQFVFFVLYLERSFLRVACHEVQVRNINSEALVLEFDPIPNEFLKVHLDDLQVVLLKGI